MDNFITLIIILFILFGITKATARNDNNTDNNTDWNTDDYLPDNSTNDNIDDNYNPPNNDYTPPETRTDELLDLRDLLSLDTVDVLARTLYGEGRGESNSELYLIGEVILNRVDDYRFPYNIKEVCLQKAQFSCWNSLYYDVLKNNHKVVRQKEINTQRYREIRNIARDIITNSFSKRLPNNCLYYFIPKTTDVIRNDIVRSSTQSWKVGLKVVHRSNKHYFFVEWL